MHRVAPALALCLALSPSLAVCATYEIDLTTPSAIVERADAGGVSLSVARGVRVADHPWPARLLRVEIPADARVAGLEIEPVEEHRLSLPAARYHAFGEAIALGAPDATSAGYAYWVLESGDFRGHRIAHVLVSAFREKGTSLVALSSLRLSIETESERKRPGALTRKRAHPRVTSSDDRILRLALDVPPLEPSARAAATPPVPPELGPERVEYVIVTTAEMAPAYQEIADLKTKEGMPAIVTTMATILSNYEGNDPAARVRSYLRDLYLHQGLRYALLAGDTDVVPARIVLATFQAPSGVPVTSDLYFAGLDGNWNADGNADLGQGADPFSGYAGDFADLYPEISVGRVPTSTIAEAAAYVAKWKSFTGYEPSTFNDDYQDRFLALGEVLFPADWQDGDPPAQISSDGADVSESTLTYLPPAFTTKRMYEYWNSPDRPIATPEILEDVIAEIDAGYGFLDHVGHGFRSNMQVGSGALVNSTADAFVNTNRYSVLYAINCTSAAVLFDCIVEHLMTNPQGGIVGGVSSTDLDYPAVSVDFKYEFFRLVFQQDVTRVADAYYAADLPWLGLATQNDNAWRWTVTTLITLGDPSLEIWRSAPRAIDLAFDASHEIGSGSVTVTVTEAGSPVGGVTVCVSKSDGYGVAVTDGSGSAVVPFLPETTGTFDVTATANSFVPASSVGTVIGSASPALSVDGWVVHDGTGGGIGNGDGRPDAGESVLVDLTLRNAGSQTATSVSAALTPGTPFAAVTDGSADFPAIAPGASQSVAGAFAFDVSVALPDTVRHVVAPAVVEITSLEGSWSSAHPFNLNQRMFDLTGAAWQIESDNGNQTIDSGETVEVFLTLLNLGDATAREVTGALGVSAGFVTLEGSGSWGAIARGQSVQAGPFRFLSTGGNESTFASELTVADAYEPVVLERRVDLSPPAAPDGLEAKPSANAITLDWNPSSATDLRGYRVSRASDVGGPFADVSGVKVIDHGSFFEDTGLTPLTTYHYRITAVDSSGNDSPPAATLSVSTAPPFLAGWPRSLPSGKSKGSPTPWPLDGSGRVVAFGWVNPMVLRADGTDWIDGDGDPSTTGVFANIQAGASQVWSKPAVADLDRDGVSELVYSTWQVNATSTPAHLWVFDETGAVEPGWPRDIGKTPWATPAVGDVDGDGDFEIFTSSGASSGDFQGAIVGFHHDGTEIVDGDANPASIGVFHRSPSPDAKFMYGSPALADLTQNGSTEVIFPEKTVHAVPGQGSVYVLSGAGAIQPGWPFDDAGALTAVTSSPAVGDLDGDGDREIVFTSTNAIHVLHHDATPLSGWPKPLPAQTSGTITEFLSSPAIGDVNGDGNLDIALGWAGANVYVWTADGGFLHAGFPVQLETTGTSFSLYLKSASIGNVDADANPEVLVSSGDNRLFAVKADGSLAAGFPLPLTGVAWGSAAITDLDWNGEVDVVVQTDAPELSVYAFPGVPYVAAEQPWPMFRHDARNTGLFTDPAAVDAPEDPEPAPVVAVVGAPRPNPFSGRRVELPFTVPATGERVTVRVFDVTGREVRTLADGVFPAGAFRIAWDGRTATGRALATGVYHARVTIGEHSFVQKLTLLR